MSATTGTPSHAWQAAVDALALHAIDPIGTGGVVLRGRPGPAHEAWLDRLGRLLPSGARVLRVPPDVTMGRLVGGLDLAATLAAGRTVEERGLLATADGGELVLPLAERLRPEISGAIVQALDARAVRLERDGLSAIRSTRFGVVLYDEGEGDERPPAALVDRLAFELDLSGLRLVDFDPALLPEADEIAAARARLPEVSVDEAATRALCEVSIALGVSSLSVVQRALCVARADAARRGVGAVDESSLQRAIELVLFSRATRMPGPDERREDDVEASSAEEAGERDEASHPEEPSRARESGAPRDAEDRPSPEDPAAKASPNAPPPTEPNPDANRPLELEARPEERLAAVRAAMPADLLARLEAASASRATRKGDTAGRGSFASSGARRGRPVGARRGRPDGRARLALLDTLRAAAPWQALRRATRTNEAKPSDPASPIRGPRLHVRRDDLHVQRTRQRTQTTTIFAVDASGSTAATRLAEAKGAVERLLAECYVRRDCVALIVFRGQHARTVLPPTRSLVRAKRELVAMPAGGGTPLASGILATLEIARQVRRSGGAPIAVFLSDGQANVAADGALGRVAAEASALAAARRLRSEGVPSLFVETSPRPRDVARRLAEAMGASWMLLPRSQAEAVAAAALDVARSSGRDQRGAARSASTARA